MSIFATLSFNALHLSLCGQVLKCAVGIYGGRKGTVLSSCQIIYVSVLLNDSLSLSDVIITARPHATVWWCTEMKYRWKFTGFHTLDEQFSLYKHTCTCFSFLKTGTFAPLKFVDVTATQSFLYILVRCTHLELICANKMLFCRHCFLMR